MTENKTTDDLSRLLHEYANDLADHEDYPEVAELFRNSADRIETMAGLLKKYGKLRGSLFKKDALSKTIDTLEAENARHTEGDEMKDYLATLTKSLLDEPIPTDAKEKEVYGAVLLLLEDLDEIDKRLTALERKHERD